MKNRRLTGFTAAGVLCAMTLSGVAQSPQSQVPDEYKKYKEHKLKDDFINPKMEVTSLGLGKYTPEQVQLLMGVNIINPNKDSAKIREMTYTMTLDGQYLGRGNYNEEFQMKGHNTVSLVLPLDVRIADLPKPQEMLAILGKKNVNAEVDTYFIATKFGVKRRVHVVYRNEDIALKMFPPGTQLPQLTPQVVAQTGTANIENVWLDNPVVSSTGERGIGLHAKFIIEGFLNQEVIFAAFFYKADGSKVLTDAQDYRTPSGHTTVQRRFTPGFESTAYDDFAAFVPARALAAGQLYVKVQILSADGRVLDTSQQDFAVN